MLPLEKGVVAQLRQQEVDVGNRIDIIAQQHLHHRGLQVDQRPVQVHRTQVAHSLEKREGGLLQVFVAFLLIPVPDQAAAPLRSRKLVRNAAMMSDP